MDNDSAIETSRYAALSAMVIDQEGDAATAFSKAIGYAIKAALGCQMTPSLNSAQNVSAAREILLKITDDAKAQERAKSLSSLKYTPLWPNGQPAWWNEAYMRLGNMLGPQPLTQRGTQPFFNNWHVWAEWLTSRLNGVPSFDLPISIAEALDIKIALGDGQSNFWNQEPHVINAEIAGWVEAARNRIDAAARVFISYNSADAASAKEVGGSSTRSV